MSCKYCDLKRRKDEDDDAEWIAGEDWESESEDGGYICPHNDGFRMLVYYDARCACTAVDNIKYCPFCGEELKAPKEPLIRGERSYEVRTAIRAFGEAIQEKKHILVIKQCGLGMAEFSNGSRFWIRLPLNNETMDALEDRTYYTIAELCGEEEE